MATHHSKRKEPETAHSDSPAKKDKQVVGANPHVILQDIVTSDYAVHSTAIGNALKKVPVSDLLTSMKSGQLISLPPTASVIDALVLLNQYKIHSVPLYDAATHTFNGFVDLLDVVTSIVDVMDSILNEKSAPASDETEEDKLDSMSFKEQLILSTIAAKNVSDLSGRDPCVCVSADDNALSAGILLGLEGHHRIAVVGSPSEAHADPKSGANHMHHKLTGVITQSGYLECILDVHSEVLDKKNVKKMSVEQIINNKEQKSVITINNKAEAAAAFKLMKTEKVSGLAVVDDHGRLVDVISLSDLMLWNEWAVSDCTVRFNDVTQLKLPILSFLQNRRATLHLPQKGRPLTCTKKTTLREATEDMLVNNVHRLFVVDEDLPAQLEGVITFGDVITAILKA